MSLTRIADQMAERARQLMAADPTLTPGSAMQLASRQIQQENQERVARGEPVIEPEFSFGSRAGAWAPPMDVPTWGVTLHAVGDVAAGFWFGQDSGGHQVWIALLPDGVAQLLRDGLPIEQQGTWSAELRGDALQFQLEVPRGWTHPVDFSPSPSTTVFDSVMTRVL